MAHDHAGRLKRSAEEAAAAGLDALVVAPGPDLLYLSGYDAPPLERLTALVVRPDREAVLIVPALERLRAMGSPAGGLVEIEVWPDGSEPYDLVVGLVAGGGGAAGRGATATNVGVSDRLWSVHLLGLQRSLPAAEFVAGSAVLSRLRARKDEDEIELLRRAAVRTDEAFRRITSEALGGRTEREVAGALAGHLLDAGLDSVAFTIVGSGPNGASPHHDPGDRRIRPGDALVLDFGGRVGGYCSDLTRTVFVGEPGAQVREVYGIVQEAQRVAFEAVAPGVAAQQVDRAARRVIDAAGHGAEFIHRTGHGIGLEEHEDPYIVEGNAAALEPGNAFSIEPGVYLTGRFGVRIEDIVVVTDAGARSLNEAPREPLVVD